MTNSWDFLQELSASQIFELKEFIRKTDICESNELQTVTQAEVAGLIARSIGGSMSYISYFDYLAFFCDIYSATIESSVQKTEDNLLLALLKHEIQKRDSLCETISKAINISFSTKRNLLEKVTTLHRTSKVFKDRLPGRILSLSKGKHNLFKNNRINLLIKLIELRWYVITPFDQQEALDYILEYLKRDTSECTDDIVSCHLMACVIRGTKGEVVSSIQSELQQKFPVFYNNIPNVVFEKLIPHSDAIIDMLMKRINNESEERIDLLKKANEAYVAKGRTLFVEYGFPYTIAKKGCEFIRKDKNDIANRLYLLYKFGEQYKQVYTYSAKGKYDSIVCSTKVEEKYSSFGKIFAIEKIANPYLKYEELAKELLPILKKSPSEIKDLTNQTHEAKVFYKLLQAVINMKERAQIAENSMHRLRHDYAGHLGIIKDYIKEYSEADQVEKEDAMNAFEIIRDAMGSIGKDLTLSSENLIEVIKEYVESNEIKQKDYRVIIESSEIKTMAQINKSAFITSVIANIFNNAECHGFILDRPKEKNVILVNLSDEGDSWTITIKNNGAKFSGDENRVFEKKYRAGTKANTGEGLYSAYTTMTAMYGSINFKSIPEAEFPVRLTLNLPKDKINNNE